LTRCRRAIDAKQGVAVTERQIEITRATIEQQELDEDGIARAVRPIPDEAHRRGGISNRKWRGAVDEPRCPHRVPAGCQGREECRDVVAGRGTAGAASASGRHERYKAVAVEAEIVALRAGTEVQVEGNRAAASAEMGVGGSENLASRTERVAVEVDLDLARLRSLAKQSEQANGQYGFQSTRAEHELYPQLFVFCSAVGISASDPGLRTAAQQGQRQLEIKARNVRSGCASL
jgi:hypothetical protein